ncbi:MAG: UDP-4-amino-4,6-dideoxy-N-acetyl-beta-L-altrosamine transaminase [Synergistaceae bacterium]|jgi:UDP-4-amino-4,6-dideoxy-N-acetyl-beta-L-altrosamine transaminase|nr:UDP-4-amino-4,6-dideoxy-N-acetyl-beta-L-altrosamine transaminase [Synergistaceae bacterium]
MKTGAARATDGVIYPYGHQSINRDDIASVEEVLKSGWLTMGPAVEIFERAVADYTGAAHAVSFSSGTAALHAAMHAAGVSPGDAVLAPPITFAATGNSAIYCGGRPIFADISPGTLCMCPESTAKKLAETEYPVRVIVPVSFAGYPAAMEPFRRLADKYGAALIEDAAHALGASRGACRVGTEADLTVFSFHPVKHITTAEGGMVVTGSAEYAEKLRRFRSHGIVKSPVEGSGEYDGPWYNDMIELGYNYRLPDILCALGTSQMKRIGGFLARRREIASAYRELFAGESKIKLPPDHPGHAYHLFVIQVNRTIRRVVFESLRASGIGVQVHYVPVHLHSFYRKNFGTREGDYPISEAYSSGAISLPIYPDLPDEGIEYVADEVIKAVRTAS